MTTPTDELLARLDRLSTLGEWGHYAVVPTLQDAAALIRSLSSRLASAEAERDALCVPRLRYACTTGGMELATDGDWVPFDHMRDAARAGQEAV